MQTASRKSVDIHTLNSPVFPAVLKKWILFYWALAETIMCNIAVEDIKSLIMFHKNSHYWRSPRSHIKPTNGVWCPHYCNSCLLTCLINYRLYYAILCYRPIYTLYLRLLLCFHRSYCKIILHRPMFCSVKLYPNVMILNVVFSLRDIQNIISL